jgi:glycosyltransferase 2 family protein
LKPNPRNKRRFLVLGLIWLSIFGLLAWALKDVELFRILDNLRQLNLIEILALIILNSAIMLLMASRWWLILLAQGYRIPFLKLFSYRLLAFGISYFTVGPQVGGEPAQIYLVQKHHGVPGSTAIASVSLEKILELLPNSAFLMMGVLVIFFNGYMTDFAPGLALLPVIGLTLLLLGYPLALRLEKAPVTWLVRRIPIQHPTFIKFQDVADASESQMISFCRLRGWTVVHTSFISGLMWAGIILEFWLMARFLGIPLSGAQAMTALVFALLAFLAPLPSGLGALEASQVFAFQTMGLDPSLGIALSLLIRARDILFGGAGLLMAFFVSQSATLSAFREKNLLGSQRRVP